MINPFCLCPMIYAPVCACNGIVYANDCLAQCDGNTNVGPVNPLLTPGDSCSLSPPCELVISGDSIVCNFPTILSASPTSTSLSLQNYQWYNQNNPSQILSNNQNLSAMEVGIFCVSAQDSVGCTDTECFAISLGTLNISSNPNPPNICLGDAVSLEINSSFSSVNWSNGQQTNMIVEYPTSNTVYTVEAIDGFGCIKTGEIFVEVDSCSTSDLNDFQKTHKIFPNPSSGKVNIYTNHNNLLNVKVYDIFGRILYREINKSINHSLILKKGFYIFELSDNKNLIRENIIVK